MESSEILARKNHLSSCSEAEFDREMESIDKALRAKDIPITARQIMGIVELSQRNQLSLVFSEPVAIRAKGWFDRRYGDRLLVDMSIGYCPVIIRGDVYRIRIPWYHKVRLICLKQTPVSADGSTVINVLDCIEDLPDLVRTRLSSSELAILHIQFQVSRRDFQTIGTVLNDEGFETGFSDLRLACDQLVQQRPEVGQSRWAALQITEKFVKAWLAERNVSYKFTHDIASLVSSAESHGLPLVNQADIVLVQCEAKVRYDSSGLKCEDAVRAFYAALRICAHIVSKR